MVQPMGQEINEGIAYLMALKQGAGTAAAAAPAQKLDPSHMPGAAETEEQFQGAEKRRSPRYKCEGSAEVREEGCEVRTWATFTDVSLHGCYVEAQATYPTGTVLQLKLEANGVRVETKGVVRVTYPYLGMGISFEELSEEGRANLKQLVMQLSHRCVVMGPGIASSLAGGPLGDVPLIADPGAAVQALVIFFENHQAMVREEFLRVLSKSQGKA